VHLLNPPIDKFLFYDIIILLIVVTIKNSSSSDILKYGLSKTTNELKKNHKYYAIFTTPIWRNGAVKLRLIILKNAFEHPDVCGKIKRRQEIFLSNYLAAGEILTRFLHIDSTSEESINEFMRFCGGLSFIGANEISTSQQEIVLLIDSYLKIPNIYNYEKYDLIKGEYTDEKEELFKERYRGPSVKAIASYLGKKTKDVKISFDTVTKSSPVYFVKGKTDAINRQRRERAVGLQKYDIVPAYTCDDVLSLVWIELASLIMNEEKIYKCACGNYFVKSSSKKTCMFCEGAPSRLKSEAQKEKFPEAYVKKTVRDKVNKYISRTKPNVTEIVKYIEEMMLRYKYSPEIFEWLNNRLSEFKKGGAKNGDNSKS
jgi:hypothetical protein